MLVALAGREELGKEGEAMRKRHKTSRKRARVDAREEKLPLAGGQPAGGFGLQLRSHFRGGITRGGVSRDEDRLRVGYKRVDRRVVRHRTLDR